MKLNNYYRIINIKIFVKIATFFLKLHHFFNFAFFTSQIDLFIANLIIKLKHSETNTKFCISLHNGKLINFL